VARGGAGRGACDDPEMELRLLSESDLGVMRSTYLKQGRRSDSELGSRLPSDPGANGRSL
jgi:hypothetical protein